MLRYLSMLFALLTSSALISVGHGALGALLVQQGTANGFSDTFIGLLITATYIGFVAGNALFNWLLPRISYIRTYAVCAAILTCTTLLMPFLPHEAAWLLLRFVHGLFFCTTVVICESWLNTTADNQNRGKLHSVYMTANYIAYGSSQYILLLGAADGGMFSAFAITALFIVLSLVPICMTRFAEPQFARPQEGGMTMADAYNIAPLAYLSQFGCGIVSGAIWLFVRYADAVADDAAAAAALAVLFFGSGFLLQFPVGWLSDRMRDRRTIMTIIYSMSTLLALVLFLGERLPSGILLVFVLLFGMIFPTTFSLNVAYGQDFSGGRASEYAGRLFQPYAAGAIIGPLAAGALMDNFTASSLFAFCAALCAVISALSFMQRFIPRFIPMKKSTYQAPATAYTPAAMQELPAYSELEIGPTLPPSAKGDEVEDDSEAAAQAEFIGPQPPDSYADILDGGGGEFMGPALPPDDNDMTADEDDDHHSWRR